MLCSDPLDYPSNGWLTELTFLAKPSSLALLLDYPKTRSRSGQLSAICFAAAQRDRIPAHCYDQWPERVMASDPTPTADSPTGASQTVWPSVTLEWWFTLTNAPSAPLPSSRVAVSKPWPFPALTPAWDNGNHWLYWIINVHRPVSVYKWRGACVDYSLGLVAKTVNLVYE